jgi:hypothetical protein
MQKWMANSNH